MTIVGDCGIGSSTALRRVRWSSIVEAVGFDTADATGRQGEFVDAFLVTGAIANRKNAIICGECETPALYAMASNGVTGDAKITDFASTKERQKT